MLVGRLVYYIKNYEIFEGVIKEIYDESRHGSSSYVYVINGEHLNKRDTYDHLNGALEQLKKQFQVEIDRWTLKMTFLKQDHVVRFLGGR